MPFFSVPVHSLPNEILLMIFSEFRNEPNLESPPSSYIMRLNAEALLVVSQVCKKWQEICLNFGKLWTSSVDVTRNKLSWARRLTRRAKAVPLIIHTNSRMICSYQRLNLCDGAWKYILEHPSCWGTLSIDRVCACTDKRALAAALTRPALSLKHFKINNAFDHVPPRYRGVQVPTRYERFMMLPDKLFSGQAPLLREFWIENVQLSPSMDFSVWKKLTVLHVNQYLYISPRAPAFRLSARKWLEVIGGLSQLEQLYLGWRISEFSESASDSTISYLPDIHLHHLSKLELVANCEQNILFDVFAKLVVPSSCSTVVTIGNAQQAEISFDRLQIGLDRRVQQWRNVTGGLFYIDLRNIASDGAFSVEVLVYDPNDISNKGSRLEFRYKICPPSNREGRPQPVYPFSTILNILGYFPVFGLTAEIEHIPKDDEGPLLNLLLRCKDAHIALFVHTDPKILRFLEGNYTSPASITSATITEPRLAILPDLDSLYFIVEPGQHFLGREMYQLGVELKLTGRHPRLCDIQVYYY